MPFFSSLLNEKVFSLWECLLYKKFNFLTKNGNNTSCLWHQIAPREIHKVVIKSENKNNMFLNLISIFNDLKESLIGI